MRSLARLSFAVLTALVMSVCFSATHTALAQAIGSSGVIISEFRLDGPNGTGDEFVEIVNNTASPKTIVSSDAASLKGWTIWGIVGGNAQKLCTIPFNTLLNPGQHFLCARTPGYELGNYAAPDALMAASASTLTADGGVALFSSEDVAVNGDGTWGSFSGDAFREDAVGFKKLNSATFDNVIAPAFREGTGLNPIGPRTAEYSFVRKHGIAANGSWSGATYNDSNNNAVDFQLVANTGDKAVAGQADLDANFVALLPGAPFDPSPAGAAGSEVATTPVFGAPGPQSTASPIERNYTTQFIRSLFDTGAAANVSPNIERNATIVCGGSRGDLILRFTYKNQTTLTQNNLKVRWIDISTINRNNANFTAVLDLLDSTAATRKIFVSTGRDLTATVGTVLANDPAPSGDGITNANPAGTGTNGPGVKVVRGTYVEGVAKTPPVGTITQVNPTLLDSDFPGAPCHVGGFNSGTVATPPTGTSATSAGITTAALPAPIVNNGSISLEHRFGVIRQGQFLIVGIIESN